MQFFLNNFIYLMLRSNVKFFLCHLVGTVIIIHYIFCTIVRFSVAEWGLPKCSSSRRKFWSPWNSASHLQIMVRLDMKLNFHMVIVDDKGILHDLKSQEKKSPTSARFPHQHYFRNFGGSSKSYIQRKRKNVQRQRSNLFFAFIDYAFTLYLLS